MYRIGWALVLTGVVVVAAGWWFGWDWSKSFTIAKDWLDQGFSIVKNEKTFTENIGKGVKQSAGVVQDFLSKAIEKQKQTAASTITEAKDSLVTQAQTQAAAAIQSFEEIIGINKDDGEIGLSPINSTFLIIIIARAGEEISFLLKNNTEQSASFHIDWGDGVKTDGLIAGSQEKLISHGWDAVGDYVITSGSKEFLVRVIK